MSLFARYVVWEVVKAFLVTLLGITLLMILVGVLKEALQQGLGPWSILRLVPFVLPRALVFAIPGTLLFAVCVVYGRLSSDNEMMAIKSLGVSPMRIVWPVLALSVLLSLATVWVYELGAVWGYQGIQRVVLEALEDIVYRALRTQRSISMSRFSIVVMRVEGQRLIQPIITIRSSGGSPNITLRAEEAELSFDPADNSLTLLCRNGSIDTDREQTLWFPDRLEYRISLGDTTHGVRESQQAAHLPLLRIPQKIKDTRLEIQRAEQTLAAQAAYQMLSGDFESLAGPQWQAESNQLAELHARLNRLKTEPPRRWATGFSCLCFACLGIPMAIRRRNSDFVSSFFICFLPILIAYYPFFMFGLEQAKTGRLPAETVWLANLVLIVWGTWLFRRVIRF